MNESLEDLVSVMLDDRLSDAQRIRLNELLQESPAAVARYWELMDNHEALCSIYPGEVYAEALDEALGGTEAAQGVRMATRHGSSLIRRSAFLAVAAALLIAFGIGGYRVGSDRAGWKRGDEVVGNVAAYSLESERTISGHAMLRRSVGLRWATGATPYRDGDVLPGGELQIESGIADIDFFCGATLTVQGPASLVIQSDWSVRVDNGRLRANVPPAARGFIVQTDKAEIIDLGTEFALDVGADSARVQVIDGEVALRGGSHDGVHLTTGQQQWLGDSNDEDGGAVIGNSADIERRHEKAESVRLVQWRQFSSNRRKDNRLIAYYAIAEMPNGRMIPNSAPIGSDDLMTEDRRVAALVGPVQRTSGRFGKQSIGLEFGRIGARARTRIDGTFRAFTFSTWVRIDSLDQVYNALFMSDGYQTGELHWQIREDGSLMFSVMVDDTETIRHFSERDGGEVDGAGRHHVYLTEPIWNISQSGRWFHLAAVYDPAGRQVNQYVNGIQVSDERIEDEFLIEELKIGPAEIGNWGQPFRKTPWFAVRNLNGTIDEMAIYGEALHAGEIQDLYEQGKPIGY